MNVERSVAKVSAAKLANAAITFLGVTYFARALGAGGVGSYFLFHSSMQVIGVATDFGIRGAVEKRVSGEGSPGEILGTALAMKLVPIAVTVAVVFAFAGEIDAFFGAPIAVYLPLAVVLQETQMVLEAVLRGELRVGETAELTLAYRVVWLAVGGGLVATGGGVEAVVFGLLSAIAVHVAWATWKCATVPAWPSAQAARSIGRYARYDYVSGLGHNVHKWADTLIVGYFLGEAAVGLYEVAWRVAVLFDMFPSAIAETVFPQVSSWDAEGRRDEVETLLSAAVEWSSVAVVPAVFRAVLVGGDLLSVLFGPEYAAAALVLPVLVVEKLLNASSLPVGRVLDGLDQIALSARATVASIATNVALNVALVAHVGILGAAVGTTVARGVQLLLLYRYTGQYVTVSYPWRRLAWFLAGSAVMSVAVWAVSSVVDTATAPGLVAAIGVGVATYAGVVLLHGPTRVAVQRRLASVMAGYSSS